MAVEGTTGAAPAATGAHARGRVLRDGVLRGGLGWAPVLLVIVLYAVAAWSRRWMSDDGFINVRAVMQLHAGNGPVFNAGERVELTTSTLWYYLLALVSWVVPAEISEVAVVLGWLFAVAAFVLAALGASQFAQVVTPDLPGRSWVLPAGLVVVAALPLVWDFATSGLEPSITFCWLALCFWGLARRLRGGTDRAAWDPWWLPVVIGLGYLVRPDAALYSVGFGVALLWQSRWTLAGALAAVGLAGAVPLGYQIFRMGYYGVLVPNTALAKGAGDSMWGLGLNYVNQFVSSYALGVPLAVVVVLLALQLRAVADRGVHTGRQRAAALALLAGTLVPALLHVLYVVRVGGDFMHGRFLLPPLFAVLLPVMVLRVGSTKLRGVQVAAVAVMLVWTVQPLALHQPAMHYGHGVTDERIFYTTYVPSHQTVRVQDWQGHIFWDRGTAAHAALTQGQRYYQTEQGVRYPAAQGVQVADAFPSIGMYAVAAGNEVTIVDTLGLADPVAARIPMAKQPDKIGHVERPEHWRVARYAAPSVLDTPADALARETLRCAPLRELDEAISGPLTPARFAANIAASVRLTTLVIPADAAQAHETLCR